MIKRIEDWSNVFIDTGIIIDLLVFSTAKSIKNNELVRKRVNNTHKLIEILKSKGSGLNIYISAISIAEVTRGKKENILNLLLEIFDNTQFTIIDFTTDIAISISKNIKDYVPGYNYNQLISQLKKEIKNENSIINARNWINDDLKIVSSAKSLKKLDVILTNDKKTFLPIAENLKLPVIHTNDLPKDIFDEISTITSL